MLPPVWQLPYFSLLADTVFMSSCHDGVFLNSPTSDTESAGLCVIDSKRGKTIGSVRVRLLCQPPIQICQILTKLFFPVLHDKFQ